MMFSDRYSLRALKLTDCLVEVSAGVGAAWTKYPVLGATREGLAPAKEGVGKHPERYKLVQRGTIFYNPMRILLGSIAMVDEGDVPGITSPDYVVFKTIPDMLDHRWFYYWLRSDFGVVFIKGLTRGAVRERLLFKRLGQAHVNVPHVEVQRQISRRLLLVRGIRGQAAEQVALLDRLPMVLLSQSLSGKQ